MLGAGPAGCAAALSLLPTERTDRVATPSVVVLERSAEPPGDRIGECLPAAAARVLVSLGVRDDLAADGHEPCFAQTSVWGTSEPAIQDSIGNLDGPAWLLDRARFDESLRSAARRRGARLLTSARVTDLRRSDDGRWIVTSTAGTVRATAVVDARGRPARVEDRLLCAWTRLTRTRPGPAQSLIASDPHGWWYTAPVPDGHRVVALFTDAGLARERDVASELVRLVYAAEPLAVELSDSDPASGEPVRVCRAGGVAPDALADPDLVSVGDASMTFDPIAGQGLFHSLCTGMAAGPAVAGLLRGDSAPLAAYRAELDRVWHTYRERVDSAYAAERRWPESPFWRRRQQPPGGTTA